MKQAISSADELGEWLEGKPRVWALLVAQRLALRVLPTAFDPSQWGSVQTGRDFLVLLRASIITSASGYALVNASRITLEEIELAKRNANAPLTVRLRGEGAKYNFPAAEATAHAAFATDDGSAPTQAAHSALDAIEAAGGAASSVGFPLLSAERAIIDAVAFDCGELSTGNFLESAPLWNKEPPWFRNTVERMERQLRGIDPSFAIWLDWYHGQEFGFGFAFQDFDPNTEEEFYLWLLQQTDQWWSRDPADVNYEITSMVEKLGGSVPPQVEQPAPAPEPNKSSKKAAPAKKSAKRSAKKATSPPPPPPPERREDHMPSHRDEAAETDQLGRQPFAKVMAARLRESRDEEAGEGKGSFFLHIDGAWGAGKSSVINLINSELASAPEEKDRWIVVDFNAWREQRNQPAWWALMSQIVAQARHSLGWRRKIPLIAHWWWWKIRNNYSPLFVIGGLIFVLVALLLPAGSAADSNAVEEGAADYLAILKDVLGYTGGLVAIAGVFRPLLFGTGDKAKAIESLSGDPYKPVMRLFDRIIALIDRPVLVVIDDLDRCSSHYVVSLLESIQTMMRDAPISYLIAGDKRWIISSFEEHYGKFSDSMDEPGRSLGHLFVDKLFQLSAPLPVIPTSRIERYWESLIAAEMGEQAVQERAEKQEQARTQARAKLSEVSDEKPLQKVIEEQEENPVLQEAIREVAAIETSSTENRKELKHRYRNYIKLMEPNPRALKKLVNYIGTQQAVKLLEGRDVPPDLLARWCVLELRWPELASALAQNAHWLDPDDEREPPEPWAQLLNSAEVRFVLTSPVSEEDLCHPLDLAGLNRVLGTRRRERAD